MYPSVAFDEIIKPLFGYLFYGIVEFLKEKLRTLLRIVDAVHTLASAVSATGTNVMSI